MNQEEYLENETIVSPAAQLIILLILAIFGALIGGAAAYLIGMINGMDLTTMLDSFDEDSPLSNRNALRSIAFANHVFTFLLPAFVFLFILYRTDWMRFLRIKKVPELDQILLASLMIFVAFPLVQFTYWLNQQLPLPDFLIEMEDSTAALIKGLLVMDSPWELCFNLIIIAILPAIAEEFVFRGIVQRVFENWMKNGHLAIWMAAAIFSFIHFQFEGFIPRLLLGALLGYLFYWTRNLWIPIIAHAVNNGFQVLAAYWYPEKMAEMDMSSVEDVSVGLTLASMVLVGGIGYHLYQKSREEFSA